MGSRTSAFESRTVTSPAAATRARFSSSSPTPVRELTATMDFDWSDPARSNNSDFSDPAFSRIFAPANSESSDFGLSKNVPRKNSCTSSRTTSSVSASTASALVNTVIPRRTPSNCKMSKCSRVCGLIPSSAAITSSTRSMPPTPASMLRTNRSCPGTSTNPIRSVSPPFAGSFFAGSLFAGFFAASFSARSPAIGKSIFAKPRSIVIPRRFSSSSRSASIPVSAFTSAVFP